MEILTGCEIEDVFCAARPGPARLGRGALTACFVCGRQACLSCSIRLEVRLPSNGTTLGTHWVCHSCAKRVVGGMDAVRVHFARMGGRGVPSQAPEAASRVVVSPPKPKKRPKPKPKPKPRRPRPPAPAPVADEDTRFYTTREVPVEPLDCPPHILMELGYHVR